MNQKEHTGIAPQNRDELTRFFANYAGQPNAFWYRDVPVEILSYGLPQSLFLALLFGIWYGIAERFAKISPPGRYLKIWLPQPLHVDLYLRSRARRKTSDSELDNRFVIDVLDRQRIDEYLSPSLTAALLHLDRTFHVDMRDKYVLFGPLVTAPADTADGLDRLIAALPRPAEEIVPPPDFGEAMTAGAGVVRVKRVGSSFQADLWKVALDNAGIPCRLHGYDNSGIWGGTGEIDIVVPSTFEKQARDVIADLNAATDPSFDEN